jgi:hypothetical protein
MARHELFEEALTRSVIGAFFDVYNTLRFGFLEHIYAMALERELLARGHRVAREVGVWIMYKGTELGVQRLDMISMKSLSWKSRLPPSFTRPPSVSFIATSEQAASKLASFCISAQKSIIFASSVATLSRRLSYQ